MSKRTRFNKLWLDPEIYPQFNDWLRDVPENIHEGYCTVCCRTFALSNMGIRAVESHYKAPIHQKNYQGKCLQKSVANIFTPKMSVCGETSSADGPSGATSSCGNSSSEIAVPKISTKPTSLDLNSFLVKDEVLKAECYWAMQVVMKKMSFNSCSDVGEVFKLMFSDSQIAKQFTLGSTKVAYLISYGLAPYFMNLLMDRIKQCTDYVICFDEAFNKIIHKGQMDLVIRFWDTNKQQVSTRYLTSVFLGSATADDLLGKFLEGISCLQFPGLLQVSMDGPNVNHSFFKKLTNTFEEDMSNSKGKKLIDIGTCGLHIIHGSMKCGLKAANWELYNLLTHLYFLFKDSPSRRAQFTAITGSEIFPLKFCQTRWVENVQCLQRAIDIFENIKQYIHNAKALGGKPAISITEATTDPFTKCKLSFFKTVASECEPLLKRFQSSKPLVPFLFESLHDLIRKLMSRFVRNEALEAAVTVKQLLTIDLHKSENLTPIKQIDVGFATRKFLKEIRVTDAEIRQYLKQCKDFLVATVEKLKERSPLKFPMIRGLSALDPFIIRHKPDIGTQRIQIVIMSFHCCNRINDDVAEKAKQQYVNLTNAAKKNLENHFEEYCKNGPDEIPLDKFFSDVLSIDKNYNELWIVIKLCLILSHGNASVESGFSINKSLLIENLHENTLINQRHVYDAILEAGGLHAVDINKKLLSYAQGSSRRYKQTLEEHSKLQEKEEKEKRKLKEQDKKIRDLEEKRKRIKKAAALEEEAIETELISLRKKHRKV